MTAPKRTALARIIIELGPYTLEGHLSPPDSEEVHHVAGIWTDDSGRFSTFRGTIPAQMLIKPLPKRGRPPAPSAAIAKYLHGRMAQVMAERTGQSLTSWRTRAAAAIGLGDAKNAANAASGVRIAANRHLPEGASLLIRTGDESGQGRHAVMLDPGTTFECDATGRPTRVLGSAWFCQWGQREAERVYVEHPAPEREQ